jgi:hypothetical protein
MADQEQELDQILRSINYPVPLPEAAFLLFGKQRRVPDFDLIIGTLPVELRAHLDPNATASSGGHGSYLLPLIDGRFLRLRIENQAIVEVSAVDH